MPSFKKYSKRSMKNYVTKKQLDHWKREARGFTIQNLPRDPPSYTDRPWNKLILNHTFLTSGSDPAVEYVVTTFDMINFICGQIGLQDITDAQKSRINFRMHSVKYFVPYGNPNNKGNTPFATMEVSGRTPQIEDTANTATTVKGVSYPLMKKVSDRGSIGKNAACGFVYPKYEQDIPFCRFPEATVLALGANRNETTLRVNLSWSLQGESTFVAATNSDFIDDFEQL